MRLAERVRKIVHRLYAASHKPLLIIAGTRGKGAPHNDQFCLVSRMSSLTQLIETGFDLPVGIESVLDSTHCSGLKTGVALRHAEFRATWTWHAFAVRTRIRGCHHGNNSNTGGRSHGLPLQHVDHFALNWGLCRLVDLRVSQQRGKMIASCYRYFCCLQIRARDLASQNAVNDLRTGVSKLLHHRQPLTGNAAG